jgi:hypothetical protein
MKNVYNPISIVIIILLIFALWFTNSHPTHESQRALMCEQETARAFAAAAEYADQNAALKKSNDSLRIELSKLK